MVTEENKEIIEKEILEKISATNEKLDAMIQLLEIIVKMKKRKTNRFRDFEEWAKTRKIIKTSDITNRYNVRKPTAISWMRKLPSMEFRVTIKRRGQGESFAIRKSEI